MSGSRSSSKNETSTTDLRTTNTINAGIGGDISDALVVSGNYGATELINAVDNSEYAFEDNSDRSIDSSSEYAFEDNSDRRIDNSVTTDGGAFDLVENLGALMIKTLGESQNKTLDAANNLAARSLDGAMSIKAGQTITEPANQTMRELAKSGAMITAIGGAAYVASKVWGKK